MKTYLKLFVALLLVTGMSTTLLSAQAASSDADKAECKNQYTFMNHAFKAGEMPRALMYWNRLIGTCPDISRNIYIWALQAIEHQIKNAATPEEKSKYVDTLMMCYDLRIKNFPNNYTPGDNALAKGIALANYAPDRHEEIEKEYETYINLMKENAAFQTSILPQDFQQLKFLYEEKKRSSDDMMNSYELLAGIAEDIIKKNPDNEKAKEAKDMIESIFISIPELSSCENLIAIFRPKMEANPTDAQLLKKIVIMLERRQCQESDLFSDAAEALYKVEKNGETASILATLFILKKEHLKAAEYFKGAIEATENAEEKSKMEVQLGFMYLTELNSTSQALACARNAISHNSSNGLAYMLIGNVYAKLAAGSRNCGEIESKSVFWAVVDAFAKAKNHDPSLATEANRSINQYSQYFPSQADAFMYGLKDGDAYTVNCAGINERTTVRTRKQ